MLRLYQINMQLWLNSKLDEWVALWDLMKNTTKWANIHTTDWSNNLEVKNLFEGALIPTWYSWKYWFGFYRHRLLRLWPAYLYVILLSIIRFPVLRYHENFPLWGPNDFGVECSKHWWENALFINTFTDGRCLPWTWWAFNFYLSLTEHLFFPFILKLTFIFIF